VSSRATRPIRSIGPPRRVVFYQFPLAEEFARKALALDPANAKARYLLDRALAMQPGKATESPLQLK
jgi:hypothetical protein